MSLFVRDFKPLVVNLAKFNTQYRILKIVQSVISTPPNAGKDNIRTHNENPIYCTINRLLVFTDSRLLQTSSHCTPIYFLYILNFALWDSEESMLENTMGVT